MEKKEILSELRKVTGNNSIKFPSQIDFSLNKSILTIHVLSNGVRDNMQTDGSAFEGWAICILSYLPYIEKVILKWDKPLYSDNIDEKKREIIQQRQKLHYNRFIMRVFFFSKYYDWFEIDKANMSELDAFQRNYSNSDLYVNYPKSESKEMVSENGKINKGEAKLERQLVDEMKKGIPITNHQLPVGIFKNKVKTGNSLTPRGASQIDIWQLDENVLRLFELKDKKNKGVGIISELMFYANIMNELVNGNINYPPSIEKDKDIRNIKTLYAAIKNKTITKIEAVFLAFSLHPLISSNVEKILEIINKGVKSSIMFFISKSVEEYYA